MLWTHGSVNVLRIVCLALGSLILTVCNAETPTPVAPGGGPLRSVSHAIDPSVPPRNMDAEFEEIAAEIPEFGGLYFDEQRRPVAFLTDLRASGRADPRLRGHLNRHKRPAADLRFVQGQFGFADLATWRRQLDTLLGTGGIWSTDIDERANKILIGVESDAAWGLVIAEAARRHIPPAALSRRTRGRVVPLVTLQQFVRPVAGGLQIRYQPGGGICTLGFVANGTYFVTNSHCSTTPAWVNNSSYYQPTTSLIGSEIMDPPVFTGGSCPSGKSCRWSDAILGYFSTSSIDYGYIEKTTGVNNGSITISGKFRITDFQAFPYGGETLNKVGRSSGWTNGTVNYTCQNLGWIQSNWMQLCQDEFSASATYGDSGSPVFEILSGNDVKLYGVLWGLDPSTGNTIMSALVNIEYELGDLDFFPW